MKLRKNFLPRTMGDIAATVFLFVAIPVTYFFELWIVIPEFANPNDGTLYWFHLALASFVMFNILSNMLAVMVCNTSIIGETINVPAQPNKKLWKLCAVCETIAPPRSWHCNTCKVCILKRDHHCFFTGCCIGHHNHRYFVMLVIYLFIGTVYASLFNNTFIWILHGDLFRNNITLIKIIFPLAMLVFEWSATQFYLFMYLINMVGCFFTGFLLFYHGRIILNGRVTHELAHQFDLGWKENIRIVLGKRWYLTWISPFVDSPLSHDGIHWDRVLEESVKNL